MGTAIELHDIVKRFPGVVANDGVNLKVESGTIHALIGENGAGKSTVMKILYGAQPPDEGTIEVNGQQVHFKSPKDAIDLGIGMVFQHFALWPHLNVLQNVIEAPLHVQRRPLNEVRAEAEALLRRVGLFDKRDVDRKSVV